MSLWQETINENGQSSISVHKPKVIGKWCKFEDHVVDDEFPNSRIAVCKICGKQIPVILGYHAIKNGKLLTVELKK